MATTKNPALSNNQKYDRCYILTVGNYSTGRGLRLASNETPDPLQLTFSVDKNSDHKHNRGNSASIEVYNLSADQQLLLDDDFLELELYVGYNNGEGAKLLVKGNVTDRSTIKRGTDSITQLIVGEGYTNLTTSRISQIVAPGQTVADVFNTIVDNMPGVARGSIVGTNLNSPIIHGWRLSGTPKEELDKLARAYNLEYHITNDTLTVTDLNQPNSKSTVNVPIISQDTGMIEQPFRITDKARISKKDKRRRPGVQVKWLLDAAVLPSSLVRIEHGTYSGFYRVSSVRFSGEFRGGRWDCELQCHIMQDEDLVVLN
ncbi:hypothetical protein ACIPZ5_17700 [Pseudomonas sp. NPDC089428]|uniref:hypothetical protein n=1 Tax=Pseudomonas sp. NPDC089428 TaxID=3364467 RepID=UPI0037F2D4D6